MDIDIDKILGLCDAGNFKYKYFYYYLCESKHYHYLWFQITTTGGVIKCSEV